MIINVKQLVEKVNTSFPAVNAEFRVENGFYEIKVIGENGSISYFYPNDLAWFVKLYPSQDAYQNHVFEEIREKLLSN